MLFSVLPSPLGQETRAQHSPISVNRGNMVWRAHTAWLQIPAPLPSGSVTLSKSLTLSGPQQIEGNDSA